MRRKKVQEFAKKLNELEKQYGVIIHSDNYYTDAIINDMQDGFSYHYNDGNIELDENTFLENEDI